MSKCYLKPKLFSVLKTYNRGQFVKDLVAGIVVAIIACPCPLHWHWLRA